jgi:hypothetical protein
LLLPDKFKPLGITKYDAKHDPIQLSSRLPLGNLRTTTVPSTSSSKSRTSRRPTMPSSADQLSPSSWRYPTTPTWSSRCQAQQVYSHSKGT